ncbi:MAG TPA: hypothetical protein VIJ78_13495 [Pseudolabrys sp.]
MNPSDSEGLGLSVLIYMAAILGGLALIAGPVYLVNRPQVYENPRLARADPLLNGPIVGKRVSTRVPLALLKHEPIVDPKIVAALNAKTKKTEPHRTTHQVAERSRGTPVAELQPEPRRPTFFLFRLFGG